MQTTEITYAFEIPRYLRQGRGELLQLDALIAERGAVAVVAAGEYSLFDSDGNAVIDAEACSVVAGIARYTLTSAKLDDESLSDGYLEEWNVTIAGAEYLFQRPVTLGRWVPKPSISDDNLEDRRRRLGLEAAPGDDGFEIQRRSAWYQLLRYLIAEGHNPAQVRNKTALIDPHILWTLRDIYADLDTGTDGPGKWAKSLERVEKQLEGALGRLTLQMDTDGDTAADSDQAAESPVFLTDLPSYTEGTGYVR